MSKEIYQQLILTFISITALCHYGMKWCWERALLAELCTTSVFKRRLFRPALMPLPKCSFPASVRSPTLSLCILAAVVTRSCAGRKCNIWRLILGHFDMRVHAGGVVQHPPSCLRLYSLSKGNWIQCKLYQDNKVNLQWEVVESL